MSGERRRSTKSVLLVAALLASGCGDNLREPAAVQSGSRLKLARYVYEGGAYELESSWYLDSALQQRCTSRMWSDGHRFCTPAIDEAVYLDGACAATHAIGRTPRGQQPAAYFATTFELAVDVPRAPSKLFRRGAAVPAPVSIWRKGLAGCTPLDVGVSYDYFELGEEVPQTQLVRLLRSEPSGGEVGVVYETTDDGFRVPVTFVDKDSGEECMPLERPNAPSAECAPVTAASIAYFGDSVCTQPVAAVSPGETPALAGLFDAATSCTQYFRVADRIAVAALYEGNGATCVDAAVPVGRDLFTMGRAQALPTFTRQVPPSTSRIQPIARVSDALELPDSLVYDSTLDTDCKHDDDLRCVPRTYATATRTRFYHSDPGCGVVIKLALVPMGECDPPSRFAEDDGHRFYPLGEPYTGPIFARNATGACVEYRPSKPFVPHRFGPAIDPATFARAELRIDP